MLEKGPPALPSLLTGAMEEILSEEFLQSKLWTRESKRSRIFISTKVKILPISTG
jgi:hypothetical protein